MENLTVRRLIQLLAEFNPDAKVKVIVENYPKEFDLAWGGAEGCTRATADSVSFYVDGDDEQAEPTPP